MTTTKERPQVRRAPGPHTPDADANREIDRIVFGLSVADERRIDGYYFLGRGVRGLEALRAALAGVGE